MCILIIPVVCRGNLNRNNNQIKYYFKSLLPYDQWESNFPASLDSYDRKTDEPTNRQALGKFHILLRYRA